MRWFVIFIALTVLISGCDVLDSIGQDTCPQIPLITTPLKQGDIGQGYEVLLHEVDGWNLGINAGLVVINNGALICKKGDLEGENPEYYYCGKCAYWGVMTRQDRNSDGTLGPVIQKYFYNIYNSEGKFLKTVCGTPPERPETESELLNTPLSELMNTCLHGNEKITTKSQETSEKNSLKSDIPSDVQSAYNVIKIGQSLDNFPNITKYKFVAGRSADENLLLFYFTVQEEKPQIRYSIRVVYSPVLVTNSDGSETIDPKESEVTGKELLYQEGLEIKSINKVS